MNLVYQTWVSAQTGSAATAAGAASDTTVATGQTVKIDLPVHQSLHIVEYGLRLIGADPSGAVLSLQYVDGAGNTVVVDTLTVPVAATTGQLCSKRIDAQFDKDLNTFTVSTRSVAVPPVSSPGVQTSEPDGFVTVQLFLTTGVAATTGTFYVCGCYEGSQAPAATGQVLV